MGTEIERKFLVANDRWRAHVQRSIEIEQGYVRSPDAAIRVRIKDGEGILTFKGDTVGVTRGEWQWSIPTDDARDLLGEFCASRTMKKTRHVVMVGDHEWVVDEFHGAFDGLLLAEVELDSEDEVFEEPEWIGEEVSHDERYFNVALAGAGRPPG